MESDDNHHPLRLAGYLHLLRNNKYKAKNMNLSLPISDIMTKRVITIGPEDNMKKVEDIFTREKIHHIPVIDEGLVVGMVSKSDYLFFKRGFQDHEQNEKVDLFRLKTKKVRDIMTQGLAKMEPDEPLRIALAVFKENLFHAILVTKNDGLIGILTPLDIINKMLEEDK